MQYAPTHSDEKREPVRFQHYPDGRKTGTVEVGRLPLVVCRCNRVRAFVPLTGTSVGSYAIRPYLFGPKN